MPSEHINGVLEHKKEVGKYMNIVSSELFKRSVEHDYSKFSNEEFHILEEVTPQLKHLTYGSEEYQKNLERIQPAIKHHWEVNRHHPEYFNNGINEMNLIDIIEMICDWSAAVKKHKDGNIYRSLEVNKTRFAIDDQLMQILKNTVDYFNQLEEGEN